MASVTRRGRGEGAIYQRHDHKTCPAAVDGVRPEHRCRGRWVSVVDYGGVLALVPVMTKPVRQAAGMLKGRTSLTRALLTEHGRERSRGR